MAQDQATNPVCLSRIHSPKGKKLLARRARINHPPSSDGGGATISLSASPDLSTEDMKPLLTVLYSR